MNLGNLAAYVGTKIGMSDAATLAKLKTFAAERYKSMYEGALWKDTLSVLTKSAAIGQSTVILPSHLAQFIAAKYDATGLIPIDQSFLFASNPQLWDQNGTPTHCSELAPIATKLDMVGGSDRLKITGGNALDTTQQVRIYGEDIDGEPIDETVQLAGTTTVMTTQAFGIVYGLSKPATQGTVVAQSNANNATYVSLAPGDTQKLHRRVRLHVIPANAITLLILAKRHPGPFTADADATNLPGLCDQALQALVHGDALEWQQQYGKAQGKFAEGLALLQQAKQAETYQASQQIRFTPAESLADGCNPNSFL